VILGFDMPLKVSVDGLEQFISPTTEWKKLKGKFMNVDRNFYVE
jgi:hypothetical protein